MDFTKPRVILPKVWITKYALTTGVFTAENVERCDDISSDMISFTQECDRTETGGFMTTYHKGEWFESEDAAWRKVKTMAERKLNGLNKQRKKLEALIQGANNLLLVNSLDGTEG